uniref:Sodium/potassium-transporting ATPase subunit beta n=1 Tax=Leptobrachium leishanense TaxID=445787 RepID=A0A8C5M4V3_9ANUR
MATFNEKKTCSQRMENFSRFVWNPDTGELMGRTLEMWVYISLYYAAFYCVMIGLFALSIFSLMKSLDPYHPDYQDRLKSPGVTMRPNIYVDDEFQVIYNMNKNSTYNQTITSLSQFLSVYKVKTQQEMNKDCNNVTDVASLLTGQQHTKYACQFTTAMLGNCSHEFDSTFGYASGQPCVFIKINRIINFVPKNDSVPFVNCTAKKGDLGPLEYFPPGGFFGLQYFPYYGKKAQPNYTNPLVAVKFLNITKNTEHNVECIIEGKGFITDNLHDPYEGKVSFRLKVEN